MPHKIAGNRRLPVFGSRTGSLILCLLFAVWLAGCPKQDRLAEARSSLREGKVAESLVILRELVEQREADPEALYLYGRALMLTGEPGPAEWPLRKAMQDPAWFEQAGLALAETAMAGGNVENGAEILGQVIERNPQNVEARLQRANALAEAPRYRDEALDEVERIFDLDPKELRAYKPKILVHLSRNEPEEAQAVLEELGERLEETPGYDENLRGWYCATMAIFADDKGEEDLARERWTECNERFPTHENVVQQSIAFHDGRKEFARALEIAQRAFETDPKHDFKYRSMVAEHLAVLGRKDEAEELLRDGIDSGPPLDSARSWLALSSLHEISGERGKAIDELERGLEILRSSYGPQPSLVFKLADLLILEGEDDRALTLADEMTVAAHQALVRARVAHKRDRLEEALVLYEETSRLWPDNAHALYHAGHAALALGEIDRAMESFLESIRVSTSATDAQYQVARIFVAEGQWEAARDLLAQFPDAQTPDASLLGIEVLGQTESAAAAWNAARAFSERYPEQVGPAIVAAVNGVREGRGRPAAWKLVEAALESDLTPRHRIPVLLDAWDWARADAQVEVLTQATRDVIEAVPNLAGTRVLEAILHERAGERAEAVQAYRRSLDVDPDRSEALLGLAALVAEEDRAEAFRLLDRALEAEKLDGTRFLRAIEPLGADAEVEGRLEAALRIDPTHGGLALRLARGLRARGAKPEEVSALERRALRFGEGGGEAAAVGTDQIPSNASPSLPSAS